nr:hypothetical protein [uncultured Noviherbaspirillum sp.]
MHRFVNTFLLWLLLAALPLQGFAAAMQLSCGTTKQHAALSHDQHDHHQDAGALVATQETGTDHASMSGHATSSCSACSACCVGAIALPASAAIAPVYSASVPAFPLAPALPADFIPGGLERPPKPVTA